MVFIIHLRFLQLHHITRVKFRQRPFVFRDNKGERKEGVELMTKPFKSTFHIAGHITNNKNYNHNNNKTPHFPEIPFILFFRRQAFVILLCLLPELFPAVCGIWVIWFAGRQLQIRYTKVYHYFFIAIRRNIY